MKRLSILLMLMFMVLSSFAQTSDEVIIMKKRAGKIVNTETDKKIHKKDLKLILDEESYRTYIRGRGQHIASIPFWYFTGSSAALATTSFIMAHKMKHTPANNNSEEFSNGLGFAIYYASGIILSLGTVTFAIPSTILTICSNKNLNDVVENYNPKTPDIALSFGATNNGIGLTLKF